MQRSLIVRSFISLLCLTFFLGWWSNAYAESTVRFQLEIVPVVDPEPDPDDKDDDDDKDKESSDNDDVIVPIGGTTPSGSQPSTPLETIIRTIIPETVVASRFPGADQSWCSLTLSRNLSSYILLNIVLFTGFLLWIIGLWWFLPQRFVCINGYASIHKREKDHQ